MNFLEERIIKDGIVKHGNVLKVDSFLNHQIDVQVMEQIAQEIHRRFVDRPINKVLTIETSGIPIAYAVARRFDVPMVIARKAASVNLEGETYVAEMESCSGRTESRVIVSKKYLNESDRVLIVDDFLANGYTLQGLISLVEAAEASVEGLGIVVEKGYQEGGYRIRNLGYRLESLAVIESMDADTGEIVFRDASLT